MDNAFRIFLETVFKTIPAAFFPDLTRPARKAATPATPALAPARPTPAGPTRLVHAVSDSERKHRDLSDSEFMDYLRDEAERLNTAFREAAARDIDPHASIEAVTEVDEFEDMRRMALIRLEPMKLLPVDDHGDGELEL